MAGTGYNPKAIYTLFDRVQKLVPRARLAGIMPGPSEARFGYHWAARDVPATDDSRQHSINLPIADMAACSAIDISFPPDLMITCTQRLIDAAKAGDPRMAPIREFAGTVNGSVTTNYELLEHRQGFGEWDPSHLGHIHLSIGRRYTLNTAALLPVADIIGGIDMALTDTDASKIWGHKLKSPNTGKEYPIEDFISAIDERVTAQGKQLDQILKILQTK